MDLFRRAAKLALIVAVPLSAANLWLGSHLGIVVTDYQPMKIASTEAQWDTCQPCAFSLFQIGGFTESDQTPSFSIQIPRLLSVLATGSFSGEVQGMDPLQSDYERQYGRGENYIPPVRASYWSMRIMAYLGTLIFLVAALGAFLYWRGRLDRTRWFLWLGVLAIPLPWVSALSGWVLTELGRQPWIVFGLLKTADANSPSVSSWTIGLSIGVFATLYVALAGAVDATRRAGGTTDRSGPSIERCRQALESVRAKANELKDGKLLASAGDDQPHLVPVPDGAHRLEHHPPLALVPRQEREQHSDAEVEPLEQEVPSPEEGDEAEPEDLEVHQ